MKYAIPAEVGRVAAELRTAGFEAYLVGGCVRDLLLGREPKDWDITTSALPEEVQKLFPDSVYENEFGTVGVRTDSEDPRLKLVEVTTYRIEGKYTDKRHPDEVKFAKTVEDDLGRRDFTVNAMALSLGAHNVKRGMEEKRPALHAPRFTVLDPYGGQKDLKAKIIRTVGDSNDRFNEDALRLLRAVRLAAELGFSAQGGPASGWEIDLNTRRAIEKHAGLLEMIAKERIRDEFIKLIMTPAATDGILLLEELNLLEYVLPELREGIGVGQDKHHIYTVFEHSVRSLDYAARKNYSLEIRLAALLHDVGKPRTKAGESPNSTFYNHEMVGARMTLRALDRLRFSKEIAEKAAHLVRWHMFYYNVGEVSPAGVRRFLVRVGPENVDDLIKVREADRIGSGVPKAVPYKLRHMLFMIEKVKRDPLSPKMLKLNGEDVMRILNVSPGPRVGWILSALLEEILDEPERNAKEYLEKRVAELGKISEGELKRLSEKAKEKKEELEEEAEEEIKKRFYVK